MLAIECVGPLDPHVPLTVVLRVFTLELLHDAVHVGVRTRDRHAWFEPSEHATQKPPIAFATERSVERERRPELRARREDEAGRHRLPSWRGALDAALARRSVRSRTRWAVSGWRARSAQTRRVDRACERRRARHHAAAPA